MNYISLCSRLAINRQSNGWSMCNDRGRSLWEWCSFQIWLLIVVSLSYRLQNGFEKLYLFRIVIISLLLLLCLDCLKMREIHNWWSKAACYLQGWRRCTVVGREWCLRENRTGQVVAVESLKLLVGRLLQRRHHIVRRCRRNGWHWRKSSLIIIAISHLEIRYRNRVTWSSNIHWEHNLISVEPFWYRLTHDNLWMLFG